MISLILIKFRKNKILESRYLYRESSDRRHWSIISVIALSALLFLCSASARVLASEGDVCFQKLSVAIDIGHYRASPGTKDVFGREELIYNSILAESIYNKFIQSGVGRAFIINKQLDIEILRERPLRAFCQKADIFISIHHDNVDKNLKEEKEVSGKIVQFNDDVEGYTVYFSSDNRLSDISKLVALSIAQSLLDQGVVTAKNHQNVIADQLRRPISQKLNVLDYRKLQVSSTAPIPAVLLEAGFLSNRHDIVRLQAPAYRGKIARAIVDGLRAACIKHPQLAGINKLAASSVSEKCPESEAK